MCVKILDNHNVICDFVQDPTMRENLREIFRIVTDLRPLLYANRFLTEDEITTVCDLCDKLGEAYPVKLYGESIFRKVHKLICTVPRFVKKHETISMFSKQSSESLHGPAETTI